MAVVEDGDRAAKIIKVYHETVKPLYAYVARRCGGCKQLAEDITQETYLRAVSTWRDEKLPAQPLAWLQVVARNLLLNYYRFRSPERLGSSQITELLDRNGSSDLGEAALVYFGLARLTRRQAALLETFYIDGKSTSEIAGELRVSERAVEGRLRRARSALRQQLEQLRRSDGELT